MFDTLSLPAVTGARLCVLPPNCLPASLPTAHRPLPDRSILSLALKMERRRERSTRFRLLIWPLALFSEAARPNLGTRHRRANYSPLDPETSTLVGTTHARLLF
ncbi:hypothetical protein TMatcc_001583 [Talaromyces marneffei ATCC 18224]